MAKFEVKVTVEAPDVLMAGLMAEGIDNVLTELGDNQKFLIDLADKQVTRKYANDVLKYLQNPMVKKLLGV